MRVRAALLLGLFLFCTPSHTSRAGDTPANGFSLVENRTRDATVSIWGVNMDSYGSGIYVRYKGHDLIITAAHVVEDGGESVAERDGSMVPAKVLYFDSANDIAVIKPEWRLKTREPVRLKFPSGDALGLATTYTGHPNHNDLLTLKGRLVGHVQVPEGEVRYFMHSFGWFGSSGAGVFDERGHLLGVISSIDNAIWNGMPVGPMEDLVIVTPITTLSEVTLRMVIAAEEADK